MPSGSGNCWSPKALSLRQKIALPNTIIGRQLMIMIKPITAPRQQQVIAETHRYIRLAESLYQRRFADIEVLFNLRGKAAGMYRCYFEAGDYRRAWTRKKRRQIRFNPWLFAKYEQDSWENTIPHEVAHYIADCLYGLQQIKPHGPQWRQIMVDFGAEPLVRAAYDLADIPTRKVSRYRYRCACRTVELSAYRHNKIQSGQQQYRCRDCGDMLVLCSQH